VPAMSDPVVQSYLKGRQALIDQENKDRSGSSHPIFSFLSATNTCLTFTQTIPSGSLSPPSPAKPAQ
jgi:hypothetical protein